MVAQAWLHGQEDSAPSDGSGLETDAKSQMSTPKAFFAADLAAVGRIAVQICLLQRLHADADDAAFWQTQASPAMASQEQHVGCRKHARSAEVQVIRT